jgi:hypothetical protein
VITRRRLEGCSPDGRGFQGPPKQCCNRLILRQFFVNGKLFTGEDALNSRFGGTAAVCRFSWGNWLVAERFAGDLSSDRAELGWCGYRFH